MNNMKLKESPGGREDHKFTELLRHRKKKKKKRRESDDRGVQHRRRQRLATWNLHAEENDKTKEFQGMAGWRDAGSTV